MVVAAGAGLCVVTLTGCTGGGSGGSSGRPAAQADPVVAANQRSEQFVASAESSIRKGDMQQALLDLTRAIEVNPTLTKAHMTMGDVYRTTGDYSSAEQAYKKAADIEPRNFDAQYYDGLMLQLMERVTEAIGAYLRALAIRPNDFNANLKISAAYYSLSENWIAMEYAKRAVELRPTDGAARLNLGAVFAAIEDHASAVREYQQAAELMPLNGTLLMNLAQSLGKLERYSEMRNTLEQLVRTEPSAAAHERLAFACFKLGNPDRAMQEFENSLKLDPDYFPALNGLGVCYLNKYLVSDQQDLASKEQAVTMFRKSMQINKNQPKVLELLGRYGK